MPRAPSGSCTPGAHVLRAPGCRPAANEDTVSPAWHWPVSCTDTAHSESTAVSLAQSPPTPGPTGTERGRGDSTYTALGDGGQSRCEAESAGCARM